jgi:hypothetical protein
MHNDMMSIDMSTECVWPKVLRTHGKVRLHDEELKSPRQARHKPEDSY